MRARRSEALQEVSHGVSNRGGMEEYWLLGTASWGRAVNVLGFDRGPVGSGFQHLKELGLLSDLLGQSIRFPWAELAAGLRTFTGVPVCKRWLLVSCARAWFVVSIKRTAFTTSMSLRIFAGQC